MSRVRIIPGLEWQLGLVNEPRVYMAVGDTCPRCLRSSVGIGRSKKKARRALYRIRYRPCPHAKPRRLIAFAAGSNVPTEFHGLEEPCAAP